MPVYVQRYRWESEGSPILRFFHMMQSQAHFSNAIAGCG